MPDSPAMRDANAVIYLVPQVGMLSFAKDKATARIAAEFYVNAINVMRGASGVSEYTGPARTGSLQHRILAARGSKAAAHAQAEITAGPRGIGHWRRRRHRLCHRRKALVGRRLRHASPTSTRTGIEAKRRPRSPRRFGKDNVFAVSMDVTSEERRHQGAIEDTVAQLWRPRHRGEQCGHRHPLRPSKTPRSNSGTSTWRFSAPAISSWAAKASAS